MVFDWFRRKLAGESPAPPPQEPQEPPADSPSSDAAASEVPDPRPDPVPVPAEPLPAEPVPAEVPAEPEPHATGPAPGQDPESPGVDHDALAWARQAYARLKAEKEAAIRSEVAEVSQLGAAPVAPPQTVTEAREVPAAAPSQDLEPPVQPQPVQLPPVQPSPVQSPPIQPSGVSLLEQAAAQREQRLRDLTAAPPAPVPAAAEETEPQLGAFDDTFTWSAEVLAAQGRRVDQVSLEEIDWLGRLRRGLEKTRRGFVTQLLDNLGDDPLTPAVLDDLESTLLRADVGVQATDQVLDALRRRLNEEVVDPAEGIRFLKEQLRGLLEAPIAASRGELLAPEHGRLNVWLLVGVNGVGKTTTLGKLANLAVRSGYSCLIAAADTFRAAAVEQVSVWGERSGVPVIANPSANADPAAVVYDAIGAARSKGTELVLVDTAGRLQTKHNLMEELGKVRRIVDKLAPEAAVESLLVLDSSQGQNGLRQAMAFAGAAGLTGVVLTKLDGSARGGVAIAVAHEAGLPIRFVGAGEGIRDLRPFNSFEFVEALLAG